MKKLYNYRKPILLSLLIVLTLFLLVLTSIRLFASLNEEEILNNNKIYGTVLEKGNNYIKLQGLDDQVYMINTNDDLQVGDFIVAYFEDEDLNYTGKNMIELIASNDDIAIGEVINPPITTSSSVSSSSTSIKTTTKTTTKTTHTISSPADDAEIVSFFSSEYNEIDTYASDQTFKEKAKEKFILFVDFIFYDGEIKGRKFIELTDSAKAKVIYYTLLIDAKIDNKWPNYKQNIEDKYLDIKAKLIAKYMEITTSLCESNQDNCANVKNDFALLKSSVGLTWDVIKNAFSYAYNRGKEHLVTWYEVFSGKV